MISEAFMMLIQVDQVFRLSLAENLQPLTDFPFLVHKTTKKTGETIHLHCQVCAEVQGRAEDELAQGFFFAVKIIHHEGGRFPLGRRPSSPCYYHNSRVEIFFTFPVRLRTSPLICLGFLFP